MLLFYFKKDHVKSSHCPDRIVWMYNALPNKVQKYHEDEFFSKVQKINVSSPMTTLEIHLSMPRSEMRERDADTMTNRAYKGDSPTRTFCIHGRAYWDLQQEKETSWFLFACSCKIHSHLYQKKKMRTDQWKPEKGGKKQKRLEELQITCSMEWTNLLGKSNACVKFSPLCLL